MRFGTEVFVTRGSGTRVGTGMLREVRGVLIGARGQDCWVRLTEDDTLSSLPEWSRIGDVGHWGRSSVRKA
jgi:hypothetical protein